MAKVVAEVADIDVTRVPTLTTWTKELRVRLPGAVPAIIRQELIAAIREFFTQTYLWREVLMARDVKAGKSSYWLTPVTPYANVIAVLSAELNGVPLRKLSRRPSGPIPVLDTPYAYWMSQLDEMVLYPTPTQNFTDALSVYVALAPNPNVKRIPQLAATQFYDALTDGAFGRLMAHPAKPYSNAMLSQYHLKRFRAAIAEGRQVGRRGLHTPDMQLWTYQRFGV